MNHPTDIQDSLYAQKVYEYNLKFQKHLDQ